MVLAEAATTRAYLDRRAGDAKASRDDAARRWPARPARTATCPSELRSLYGLGALAFETGDLRGGPGGVRRGGRGRASTAGRPWAPYAIEARQQAANVAFVQGDWDDAVALTDVRDAAPPAVAEALLAAQNLAVLVGRGDPRAVDLLRGGAPLVGPRGRGGDLLQPDDRRLRRRRATLAAAIAVHDDIVTAVTTLWKRPSLQAQVRMSALLLGQLAAHAAPWRGAGARRPRPPGGRGRRARAGAATWSKEPQGRPGPEGAAWVARLAAEHARLRWLTGVDAPDVGRAGRGCGRRAVGCVRAFGHVFETARSQVRLAAVLRAGGRGGGGRAPAGGRPRDRRCASAPSRCWPSCAGSGPAAGRGRQPATADERPSPPR